MTEIYSNEHGALVRIGSLVFLRVPTQVEVQTREEEITGLDMKGNVSGSFRLCLDRVTVYGFHSWTDEADFGGRVSVLRYVVEGRLEADKLDVPVSGLQDLLARYDELERDEVVQ